MYSADYRDTQVSTKFLTLKHKKYSVDYKDIQVSTKFYTLKHQKVQRWLQR